MTRNLSIIALVLSFVLLSTPSSASADTIWSWSFDETHFIVGQNDSIVLRATLFNSPLSTEPLVKTGGASFTGDLQKIYHFEWGPDAQFFGLSLDPGDSFTFVLGTLTPISPPVPVGTYPFCCEAHLSFGSLSAPGWLPPLNTFEIEVVPEPPMWALWAVGVLPFVWRRRRA
jgi:hypothetical protein